MAPIAPSGWQSLTTASQDETGRSEKKLFNPEEQPQLGKPIPASAAGRVLSAYGKGVVYAPQGLWHATKNLGKSIVEHPLITLGAIVGGIFAVKKWGPKLISRIGTGIAAAVVGFGLFKSGKTAVEAKNQQDMEKAARQAGDAYGEGLLQAGLAVVPGVVSGRITNKATATVERLTRPVKVEEGAAPASVESAATFAKMFPGGPQMMIDDLQSMIDLLPPGKRAGLEELVANPAFTKASDDRKLVMLVETMGTATTKFVQMTDADKLAASLQGTMDSAAEKSGLIEQADQWTRLLAARYRP